MKFCPLISIAASIAVPNVADSEYDTVKAGTLSENVSFPPMLPATTSPLTREHDNGLPNTIETTEQGHLPNIDDDESLFSMSDFNAMPGWENIADVPMSDEESLFQNSVGSDFYSPNTDPPFSSQDSVNIVSPGGSFDTDQSVFDSIDESLTGTEKDITVPTSTMVYPPMPSKSPRKRPIKARREKKAIQRSSRRLRKHGLPPPPFGDEQEPATTHPAQVADNSTANTNLGTSEKSSIGPARKISTDFEESSAPNLITPTGSDGAGVKSDFMV